MTAPSLEVLYQLERAFELSFQSILKDNGIANVFVSRQTATAQSPYVAVKMVSGGIYKDHQKVLGIIDVNRGIAKVAYDTWTMTLKVTVVTNRTENGDQHPIMLGKVRESLQYFSLVDTFPATEAANYFAITDSRELESEDSFDDENNLDITEMNWYELVNIKSDAWPEGA